MDAVLPEIQCRRVCKRVKQKRPGIYLPGLSFSMWAHLESNQAPTDYESVALTE